MSNKINHHLNVVDLTDGKIELPKYAKEGDSGMDVRANIKESMIIHPGERKIVPIGIKVAIHDECEIQVRPRSGLAYKKGVTVLNTPGTIDSGYRNEIGVILINHGDVAFDVHPGERVAQIVLCPVLGIKWNQVDELDETDRGEGGFGSTGTK